MNNNRNNNAYTFGPTNINDFDTLVQIVDEHIHRTDNPHRVNRADIELDKVDNTSDLEKPLSNPQKEYVDNIQADIESEISGVAQSVTNVENKMPVANAEGESAGPLNTVSIDNVIYDIIGTKVIANPQIPTENTLSRIAINENVYNIEGSDIQYFKSNDITPRVATLDNKTSYTYTNPELESLTINFVPNYTNKLGFTAEVNCRGNIKPTIADAQNIKFMFLGKKVDYSDLVYSINATINFLFHYDGIITSCFVTEIQD